MTWRFFKYLSPLLIYVGGIHAFTSYGIICYLPLIYAWLIIPIAELFIPASASNLSIAEEELEKSNKAYDLILYAVVAFQMPVLFIFLYNMQDPTITYLDMAGRIGTMGLICGTLGINVGHELGHRSNRAERMLARLSLLLSLYMHFIIEHNKGHHRHVATPGDPSSARYGEMIYTFWVRTIFYSYISAWKIANDEMRKQGRPVLSLHNEMVLVHFAEFAFTGLIYVVFGGWILLYYLMAALLGVLLLETVNYIEHYGLSRKAIAGNRYERAMPQHSWNSNHVIGRIMLFELSRHSDHHYLASRKYQILRHHENAPQMPTGYPGMMLLSLVPPLWFRVMNWRAREINVKCKM